MKRVLLHARALMNRTLHQFSKIGRSGASPDLRPVFIIGAPRTGSTALYQLATHCLDVGYFDNLATFFSGSSYLGVSLSRAVYGKEPHGSFRSVFGNTREGGLHAPNECGSFWYRWLPRDEHFAAAHDLGEAGKRHLRTEIDRAQRASRSRAFVFKNLNAGQRLQLIATVLPDARFIWCRRNFDDTVKSIIRVRRALGLGAGEFWSIRPRNWSDLLSLTEEQMVVRQVRELEQQIAEDLALFPEDRVIELDYGSWRKDVVDTVRTLGDFIGVPIRSQLVQDDIQELPRYFEQEKAT